MSAFSILHVFSVLFIVMGVAALYIYADSMSNKCASYILDSAHEVPSSEVPQGVWGEKMCSGGNKSVIVELAAPSGQDSGWRRAIYCSAENVFWVADQRGDVPPDESGSMVEYYGPFRGKPCVTRG